MIRALIALLTTAGLLAAPSLALADEAVVGKDEKVTQVMMAIIIGSMVLLAIVVAFEVRKQK